MAYQDQTREFIGADDSTFEQMLNEISDRFQAGEPVDIQSYCAQAPALADRIRKAVPGIQALMQLGHVDAASGRSTQQVGEIGDYRIMRELGRGGMGVVYEAEQITLGRRVALKLLPFAAMMDDRQLARFKNEARAAATLGHPHIVSVYGIGQERGVHYYAMQLIEGQSLAEIVAELRQISDAKHLSTPTDHSQFTIDFGEAPCDSGAHSARKVSSSLSAALSQADDTVRAQQGAITTKESTSGRPFYRNVARLGVQAAEALDHAHSQGVLHRDVKPANLMIDKAGNLFITDFGLARIEADAGVTMTGDLLGTLRYMSPEQALAKRVVVDHRCDVYSLGATLYELLTLRPAYPGDDRQQLLKQIAFEDPPAPRSIVKRLPAELDTIVRKAMEKNPDDRYATAADMAADLQRYLDDEPIHAKPPGVVGRATKWARRHQGIVATTVFALVACSAILAVSTIAIWKGYGREFELRRDAESQRQRADTNLKLARDTIDDIYLRELQLLDSSFGALQASQRQKELLEKAVTFYQTLPISEQGRAEIDRESARVHANLGRVYFHLTWNKPSLESLEAAVQLQRDVWAKSGTQEDQRALIKILGYYADTLDASLYEDTVAVRREVLDLLNRTNDASPLEISERQISLAESLTRSMVAANNEEAEQLCDSVIQCLQDATEVGAMTRHGISWREPTWSSRRQSEKFDQGTLNAS